MASRIAFYTLPRRMPEILRHAGKILAMLATVLLISAPANARGFIRDAEIEATLQLIAKPILIAAGLRPDAVRIVIVKDPSINAFVNGRDTIFLHTGMLTRLKTVPMIQSVIAHEVGHITGGHLITRGSAARNAQSALGVGMLLAAVAARSGGHNAAAAIAAGGFQVANRNFLSHTRAEEAAADQASIRFMARAGVDPQGALDALALFRGQEILSERRRDPYATTHPLNSQRISYLRDAVAGLKSSAKPVDPTTAYWHRRMVAKFEGYLRNPKTILERVKSTENVEIATYMKAIAYHKLSKQNEAHANLDALIQHRPSDPFYHELKGQFYLEAGQVDNALRFYKRAYDLRPKDPQLQAGYARALMAKKTQSATKQALALLEKASRRDPLNPAVYRDLSMANGRLGRDGHASLAAAERFALIGRLKDAKLQATRSLGLLPEGTPAWRKANDIVSVARRAGL